MLGFKRLWSAIEWGFFYGFLTWILSTGISIHYQANGREWTWIPLIIIIDRILMAVILFFTLKLDLPRWIKGVVLGIVLSIPLGWIMSSLDAFNTAVSYGGAIVTGIICGVLMAYSIRYKTQDEPAENPE